VRNHFFNRLPTECELVFDYIETIPITIPQLFQEQPHLMRDFDSNTLSYDFLPSLDKLQNEGINNVFDICAIANADDQCDPLRTILLCDQSRTEMALLLYRRDIAECKFPPESVVGRTISIKDAIYRENSGRYRLVLKLKHTHGSYVIVGDRDDPNLVRRLGDTYLPRESARGRELKRALEEWWRTEGRGASFRNLSRTREICPLAKLIAKAPAMGKVYETVFATIECPVRNWPHSVMISDETGEVLIGLGGLIRAALLGIRWMDGEGPTDPRRFDFRQVMVECSCSKVGGRPRVEVEAVEEVPFGELACLYAQLIERL
jgi:hypothetical protein